MKLSLDTFPTHLRQARLAPAYLLSGDEDLLVAEAADALRAAARQAGYTEREVHFPRARRRLGRYRSRCRFHVAVW